MIHLKNLAKIILVVISISPHQAHSHSGRTNSYGCHTNHSNSVYHCHEPKRNSESTKIKSRNPASVKIPKELTTKVKKKKHNN